jgi:ABC transport system ATP-binding/permease protein
VAEFKHVGKSFIHGEEEVPILKDFSLRILRGDRIGILGRNGSGKSTFLKLLTGEMTPDSGHIRRGKTIEVSYFDQSRSQLDPQKTLWETLCPDGGDTVFLGSGKDQKACHVCGYLKQFLFDPKSARDRVGTLSGGQQNRLLLAKVLANPGNVLILDEPTNDLDMDTLDLLQEMLADYPGTLLLVSHDRDFLDRTVTEIIAFEGNGVIESHIGGYSDYLAACKPAQPTKSAAQKATPPTTTPSAEGTRKTKLSFNQRHELTRLPSRIEALELEIAALKTLLGGDLYARDPDQCDKAIRRLAAAQEELETSEARWLELEALRIAGEV